ncbi:MAG: sigma-70 family RNA polymerase sigma factor [Gemmataceae bacterium]|nr:sigma-70 family RNA polymerase sigma factor [Gemmataceae bacterium]
MAHFSVNNLLGHIRRLLVARTDGDLPDRELLQRFVQSRDEAAFSVLMERHGPLVHRMCQRLLRDPHAAEDAFQATFLVLARKAASVRRPEALGCWLHGVAYKVASRARQQKAATPVEEPQAIDRMPDPLTEMTLREARAMLHEALERLPEKYRLPLILCYLEEQTRDEAARQLGWPEGTFKRRLERGRELLREQLSRHGATISAGLLSTILSVDEAQALPLALKQAALESAVRFAAGEALAGVPAARLAQAVLGSVVSGKLKLAIVLALALTVAGTGATALMLQPSHGRPANEEPVVALADAPAAKEPAPPEQPMVLDVPKDPLPAGAVARMGTLRFRQGGMIMAVAFAPDGKSLATAGNQKQPIRLWDLATGKERQRYDGQAEQVQRMLFSSDGKFLIAAEQGQSYRDVLLRQWDVATGKALRHFKTEINPCSLALSADNRTLAVGGLQGEIQLFDVAEGKELRSWKERQASIDGLAFSPNGKYLASGGCFLNGDNKIRVWDAATGKLVRHIVGHEGGIMCCAFSPDSKTLASGGQREGRVHVWDVETGKHVHKCDGAPAGPLAMVRFQDAQTLVAGSYDGTIRTWDVATGKQRHRFKGPATTNSVALSPDGKTVAVAGRTPTFQLWDVGSGKALATFEGHHDGVNALSFVDDTKTLVSASKDGGAKVWDTATGKARAFAASGAAARTQVVSPDGRIIATVEDKVLRVSDTPTGKQLHEFPMADNFRRQFSVLAFAPNSKVLAFGSTWGPIHVHDLATGKELHKFGEYPGNLPGRFGPVPRCPFHDMALSPDGRLLVTAEAPYFTEGVQVYNSKVRVWDLLSGTEVRQFEHKNGILVVRFSPDGRSLVTAGQDKAICFWETSTGKLRNRVGPIAARVTTIAISTDGRTLAWGEDTGRVVLFDVLAGKEVRAFQGHQGAIDSLRFSTDGTRLASGSDDTTILIWDVTQRVSREPAMGEPSAKELEALWADLLADDAARAGKAIATLARAPQASVPFLSRHAKAEAGVDPKRMAQLLADLESNEFMARQKAEADLERLGEQADPYLRKILEGKPSLDVRQRVEKLLAKVTGQVWPAETLRAVRAVEVLESIGTPEAKKELERLAQGGENARLTREAKGSLQRLSRRAIP